MLKKNTSINDRKPNFRDSSGRFFLVKCFVCGRENYAGSVASGTCEWCKSDSNACDSNLITIDSATHRDQHTGGKL